MIKGALRAGALATALAAVFAWPVGASAATTIGQTGNAGIACQDNRPWVPDTELASYTAPLRGVITSWSTMGSATLGRTLQLLILQPGGGTVYTAVQKDQVRPIATNVLNTFTVKVPMEAGQVLGLFAPAGQPAGLTSCAFDAPGALLRTSLTLGEPALGTPVNYNDQRAGSKVNASAVFVPSNTFTLGEIKRNKKKGTATLTVNVPNPGELALSGNGVKTANAAGAVISKTVTAAGEVKLKIRAKGKKRKTLNETGKVKIKAKITFTPTGGDPSTQSKKLKLKKR